MVGSNDDSNGPRPDPGREGRGLRDFADNQPIHPGKNQEKQKADQQTLNALKGVNRMAGMTDADKRSFIDKMVASLNKKKGDRTTISLVKSRLGVARLTLGSTRWPLASAK